MAAHKMKVVKQVGDGPLFSGSIPAGIGEHDYLCGRCNEPVLKRVDEREPTPAVFQCVRCEALNVIRGPLRESNGT